MLRGIDCSYISDQCLSMPACGPDGFDILVFHTGGSFVICLDGLEEHLASDDDVIEWAMRAQSADFRLRTDFAGNRPCRWSLEQRQANGAWHTVLASGYVHWFRSRRTLRTQYRSNAFGRSVAGAVCLALALLSDGTAAPLYANSPAATAPAAGIDRSAVTATETVDIGIALARQGNAAAALAKFDEAIRTDPKLPIAYLNRGVAHANAGTLTAAVADFTSVISFEPDNARAYYNRGFSHWRLRSYSEANSDFEHAIAIAPDYAHAYAGRALVRAASGQHASVIADCNTAIALGLDDAKVHTTRAFAYMALGRDAAAIADFEFSTAADPDNAATYSALIKQLKR
jgi:tetratricopeptide (TPR) repeat protein